MKTIATAALGLSLIGGCAPHDVLEPGADAAPVEASAYLAAPACGPAAVTSLTGLLPDDKIIGAMELDVQHLRRGKLFSEIEGVMKAEAGDVLGAMKECGVPLSKVDGIVLGFSDGDDIVMAAQAKGLGEPATLDCFAEKIERSTGEVPWTRVTRGCTTTLEIPDGRSKGFVVGRDMVVLASKSLEGAVERRAQGKDKSALDGRLAWVRREVDTSGTAWVASNLPPAMAAGLGPPMSGVNRVGVGIDASKGLGLKLGAGFGTAADASAAVTEIESQLSQVKMMLPIMGLPSSVGDSIAVAAKGNLVSVGMFLTPSDLEALRKAIEGATGGGGSAPTPPRKPSRPGI